MSDQVLTGGCLCGAFRFELRGRLGKASYCHCTRCQRRTGTAASAQAWVDDASGFHVVTGGDALKAWRPPSGFEKIFCSECGAHVMSRDPDDHSRMSIRLGAFDGDPGVRPVYRQFVAYAAAWEPIPDDGLRRYDESGRAAEAGSP